MLYQDYALLELETDLWFNCTCLLIVCNVPLVGLLELWTLYEYRYMQTVLMSNISGIAPLRSDLY